MRTDKRAIQTMGAVAALSAMAAIGSGGATWPKSKPLGEPATPELRKQRAAEKLARRERLMAKAAEKRARKNARRAAVLRSSHAEAFACVRDS
jgi:hypothetical protein